MAGPSAQEQLLLELMNEARLDPLASAGRFISSYAPLNSANPDIAASLDFFGVAGPALRAAFATLVPAQPLAWNAILSKAAKGHSQVMIDTDLQTHQAPGEAGLGARLDAAGYVGRIRAGESVYAYGRSLLEIHAGFMVDWGNGPNGIQNPPGHRLNLMDKGFNEIGLSVLADNSSATDVGPLVTTLDFGQRATGPMLVGVAFADGDGDGFYSVGEGRSGLKVKIGSASVTGFASGGYGVAAKANANDVVTLSGGGLAGSVTATVHFGLENEKLDVVGGAELRVSTSTSVTGPVATLKVLGIVGLKLGYTGDSAIKLVGGIGADTLSGGAGNDRLDGKAGADHMAGGKGDDTYIVDNAGDRVVEGTNAGADTVRASITYTLGANLQDLVLTGSGATKGTGNALGNDITGNAKANTLSGKDGADTLSGGSGDDVLVGGKGRDIMTGGAGHDRFAFAPGDFGGTTRATGDRITDFSHAQGDRIDLSAIDARPGGGDNAFAFIGSTAFTGHAGELRFAFSGGNTYVAGDLNGDGAADFMIRLDKVVHLVAGDFLL